MCAFIPAHHGLGSDQNCHVTTTGLRRNRLNIDGGVARGEVAEPVVAAVPVLSGSLVEVQGVTEGVVLVIRHALWGAVAVEPPNEGLPPGTRHDLRPLADLLDRPEATRPPPIAGAGGMGLGEGGGGGGAHALPPHGTTAS